jgi:hypothetical protein
MTFTPFTIETLRSLTLNEVFMGRIKLATRSCFWIDPLVKPVRLAALKRIAYDKPIRKQLILSKLIESNDNHMNLLERMAIESKLSDLPVVKEQSELITKSDKQEVKKEDIVEEHSPLFKPFLNRIGQLIINPVGRSKEFFSKHNQQLHSDFVKPISSENTQSLPKELSSPNGEQSIIKTSENTNRYIPLGRGHKIHTESYSTENVLNRPQSIPVSNIAVFHHSKEHSPFQTIGNTQQSLIDSTVTTPSEIGPNKMYEMEIKTEEIEEEEEIYEVIY